MEPPFTAAHLTPQLHPQQIWKFSPARFVYQTLCGSMEPARAPHRNDPDADTYGLTDSPLTLNELHIHINNRLGSSWVHVCAASARVCMHVYGCLLIIIKSTARFFVNIGVSLLSYAQLMGSHLLCCCEACAGNVLTHHCCYL